jgi:sulfatase modifying factor 1
MKIRPPRKPERRRKLAGMKLIRGGDFLAGSDQHYPEEQPVRLATVGDFWIDEHPVTNREFAAFVRDTAYITLAEIPPDPRRYPGMDPAMAQAGSAVFNMTDGPVDLTRSDQWWRFEFGANWRHPLGPGSTIVHLSDHPVVQVAYADAAAFAAWAGKTLPNEAEWEYAARGGLAGQTYAWGDTLTPEGRLMANYWPGQFPWQSDIAAGDPRTSPIGTFPPNGYGLFDMIGNVWEWTDDWFSAIAFEPPKTCCSPPRHRAGQRMDSVDPETPYAAMPRKVVKGGSHLCAANYCERYRPAARHPQCVDSPTSHVGFRCIVRR